MDEGQAVLFRPGCFIQICPHRGPPFEIVTQDKVRQLSFSRFSVPSVTSPSPVFNFACFAHPEPSAGGPGQLPKPKPDEPEPRIGVNWAAVGPTEIKKAV